MVYTSRADDINLVFDENGEVLTLQELSEAHARALVAKRDQAKAQIAARRALKRKAEADRRARYTALAKAGNEAPRKPAIPEFWTAFGHTFRTGPASASWRDESEFLTALARLCELYGVAISGCGCCGSPALITIEAGQKLIGYTHKNQLEPVFALVAPKAKKPRGDDLEGLGIGLSGMVEDMGPLDAHTSQGPR